jgi:hypothetical protein
MLIRIVHALLGVVEKKFFCRILSERWRASAVGVGKRVV